MGVKQLHSVARRYNAYHDHGNVNQLLDENNVKTIVIDFCPTFFDLLVDYGVHILPGHLQDQKDFRLREPDVQGFVDACLARIEPLLANENRRIVLVIDGDAHPVKKKTHKKRELEAMKAFNQARHQYISSHGNIQDNPIFLAKAKKWLRFTPEIKDETILEFEHRGIPILNFPTSDNAQVVPEIGSHRLSCVEAPFEADGVVIALADLLGTDSAIISVDGDLLAYGGCLDNLRIMDVNWETLVVNRYCFKRQFLNDLGLHFTADHDYMMAQKLILVLASVSGNDYAENIPTYSFGRMRERLLNGLQVHREEYWGQSMYTIQQRLLATFNNLPAFITEGMIKALVMYAFPLADMTNNRGWAPLDIGIDQVQLFNIVRELEAPRHLRGPTEVQQDRFTLAYNVQPVPRENTAPEFTGDLRLPRQRIHAGAARGRGGRGRGGRGRGGRGRGHRGRGAAGMAATITIPSDENSSETLTVAAKNRAIRTWSIGLYSTVLSASMTRAVPFISDELNRFQMNFNPIEGQAIEHTRLICDILHKESKQMSFVRQVAFQMVNIALRHADTYFLTEEKKMNFYKEFFSRDSNKIWTFILNCAMTRNSRYTPPGAVPYEQRPFFPLQTDRAQTGIPSVGNPMEYTAYADDNPTNLQHTIYIVPGKDDFRNVMLEARAQWYQYYRDNDIAPPELPTTQNRKDLIASLAAQMDTCFKVNFIEHFLSRTQDYVTVLLTTIAGFPLNWPVLPDVLQENVESFDHEFYTFVKQAINSPIPVNIQNRLQHMMQTHNQQRQMMEMPVTYTAEVMNNVITSVQAFVTAQRNKRSLSGTVDPMTYDDMKKEVSKFTKRPVGWPQHPGFPQYVVANVFYIPWMNRDERTENIVNDDICRQVHEQFQACTAENQLEVREFIRDVRGRLEKASYGWMIGIRCMPIPPNTAEDNTSRDIPLDIFDCMDLPRPSLQSRILHAFVDVSPNNPEIMTWQQNMQDHWVPRLQQSRQYFEEQLAGMFEQWNQAARLTQAINALPNQQQPEMYDLHDNEFESEWQEAAHTTLNKGQRLDVMITLLYNFYQITIDFINEMIRDEMILWYELWRYCKDHVMELRDVLYHVQGHPLLDNIIALEDTIQRFQNEIDAEWRTQLNAYDQHVREADLAISQRYATIAHQLPEVLPLGSDGHIIETDAVQFEYNFWREILQEKYRDFDQFCLTIQQPLFNGVIERTTNLLTELEEIQLAIRTHLDALDAQAGQEEEEEEEEEDVVLDSQDYDEEDEDQVMTQGDDDAPTSQGSTAFRTHALIPMLVMMLEQHGDQLSFALCPKGRSGNVFIPINRAIGRSILEHIDYFAQGLPNYANLGQQIQTLQQCVTYTRLIGYSESPFMTPLSSSVRAVLHDMVMDIINQFLTQPPVINCYTELPIGVEITDIHEQMIHILHEFGLVAQVVNNDHVLFPVQVQICALYGSQLYCDQQLLIRMLRIRTLLRSRVLEMQEPPQDIDDHGWLAPPPLAEGEYQRMMNTYNQYYSRVQLDIDSFRQAYTHCYNRLCWERLVSRQYNQNNPGNQLPDWVIGQYLDQWQSANVANVQANQLHKNWNPYPFFISPQYQSFVSADGHVTTKHSRYYREFNRTIQGVGIVYPRYTIDRLMTDGVRVLIVVRDWRKRMTRSRGNPIKYIPEVRKRRFRELHEDPELREDNQVNIQNMNIELDQRVNLIQRHGITGVIGVDLGETFAAGTFFLPSQNGVGVQHTIKRRELYGLTLTNRAILESEKRSSNIHEIESMLSLGSTYSDLNRYKTYIHGFQVNDNGLQLNNFYSRRSVIRRGWTNRLSIKAAKDKACTRVLSMQAVSNNAPTQAAHHEQAVQRRQNWNQFQGMRMIPRVNEATFQRDIVYQELDSQGQAEQRRQARIQRRAMMTPEQQEHRLQTRRQKRRNQRRRPAPTTLVVALGMDGLTSGNHRRGAPAAMDMSFASQLVSVAKARNHYVVRCDEFRTSKICPRCAMLNRETIMHFLTVPVPFAAQPRESIRVLVCDTCNKHFHRDGSAAHNIASNTMAFLQFGQRIRGNIRNSRRIPHVQYGGAN